MEYANGDTSMSSVLCALVQRLEQKAQAYGIPANSWDGYAIMLRYVEGVLQRLPTLNDLEACDIDTRFTTELELLARLVADLFPSDSFEELATFLVSEIQQERR